MTSSTDRTFTAELIAAMREDIGRPPDDVLARALRRTEQTRRLPRVAALLLEPPMILPERVVVGVPRGRLLLVAAALLIGFSLVASGLAGGWMARLLPTRPPDALEQIRATGVIRVAVAPQRPQTAAPGATETSFEVDLAKLLAARLGLRAEVAALDVADPAAATAWDVGLPKTADWDLDRSALLVSGPYVAWPRSVLVRAGSGVASVGDVQGQPVCAVDGDAGQRWLLAGFGPPNTASTPRPPLPSSLILRASDEGCLEALANGSVVAMVTSAMSPADIAAHPELDSIAGPPAETRAIVVRRAGPDPSSLFAAVEDSVDRLRRDGVLTRLSTEHFGADLTAMP